MAKQSKIEKNEKRKAVVERYAARRAELKEIIRRPRDPGTQPGQRGRTAPGTPAAVRAVPRADARAGPRRIPSRSHQVVLVISRPRSGGRGGRPSGTSGSQGPVPSRSMRPT
jgi:small subunit ribosomal protein S14